MKELLDKLIAEAPKENDGAVEIQLQIASAIHAGSMRKSPEHEGVYELLTIGQRPSEDGKSAIPIMVSIFFKPEAVTAVFVARKKTMVEQSSGLFVPGGMRS